MRATWSLADQGHSGSRRRLILRCIASERPTGPTIFGLLAATMAVMDTTSRQHAKVILRLQVGSLQGPNCSALGRGTTASPFTI